MLTLAGRVVIATLGLSFLLVVAQAIRAEHDCPDEIGDLATPERSGMAVAANKSTIIRAKAPPELLPDTVSDATPVSGQEAIDPSVDSRALSSRRRRTEAREASDKSSRRLQGTARDVTELAIERLRRHSNDDYDILVPRLADRSTLNEVMRRLAESDETCPLCGKPCANESGDEENASTRVRSRLNASDHRALNNDTGHDNASRETELARPLQTGEPAQVILDTQRRLGKSVLEGTEFGGSPEMLIQWIRALDDENRRQQALIEEVSRPDADEPDADRRDVSTQSQVDSLRNACRQLQESADSLEEQNLFAAADSIRTVADALRRQARTIVGEVETKDTDHCETLNADQ